MIKIKENYAEAVIYSDELDSDFEGLIETLCNINPNEPVICDTEKVVVPRVDEFRPRIVVDNTILV